MVIYLHKVKMKLMDGWGRDLNMSTETLGAYSNKQDAIKAKEQRDSANWSARYCDVGQSWIETQEVK
jgi:hypothetical protein